MFFFPIIRKIDLLLITWINATSVPDRSILEESLPKIKHSLVFAGDRISDPLEPPTPASELDVPPSSAPPYSATLSRRLPSLWSHVLLSFAVFPSVCSLFLRFHL